MVAGALTLAACAEAPPLASPPDAAPPGERWQDVFDAAGWPAIAGATRISSRTRLRTRTICIEGWRLREPGGPAVIFDDLHVEWANTFWEQWPQSQRVPRDRYLEVPSLALPVRRQRVGRRRSGARTFVQKPALSFVAQVVEPDCAHPSSGPSRGADRLFWLARARWAQMLGHPEVAAIQIEREPDAFAVDDGLYDEIARVIDLQAKWGLVSGMPRRAAAMKLERALALARSPEMIERIEQSMARVGKTAATLGAEPTVAELVAALPDDPTFPSRRWASRVQPPGWVRERALQPLSPGWELVMHGWDALPALRSQMRSVQWTRNFISVITAEGEGGLRGRSVATLALAVATRITGRTFESADDFDAWWHASGEKGAGAAWNAFIAEPDDSVYLPNVLDALLRMHDGQVWATVSTALADPDYPQRASLLGMLPRASDNPAADDLARTVALARRHIHDDAQDVGMAAAVVLVEQPSPRTRRIAFDRLMGEIPALASETTVDAVDSWWDAVRALDDVAPSQAKRLVRAAVRQGDPELSEDASDWLEFGSD
ncbi:MAG: hypothetical protein AAF721_01455 [Myxococcota bacterium]